MKKQGELLPRNKRKSSGGRLLSTFMVIAMLLAMLPTAVFATGPYDSWAEAADAAVVDTDYTVPDDDGDTYTIKTAIGLAWFAASVNSGITYADKTVQLEGDINLSDAGVSGYSAEGVVADGTASWTPIGTSSGAYFQGTFDGDNKTISNLYISKTDDFQGLFSVTTSTTSISNLTLTAAQITGTSSIGGIVGDNRGTITNCHTTGDVNIKGTSDNIGGIAGRNWYEATIDSCTNAGTVNGSSGSSYVGGIAGYNLGSTIEFCSNTGTVTSQYRYVGGIAGANESYTTTARVTDCYNTGSVSANGIEVGGIVGRIVGRNVGATDYVASVQRCYNTGIVTTQGNYVGGVIGYALTYTSVTDCYNIGAISGKLYVGAVVGSYDSNTTLTNCYYNTETSGASDTKAQGLATINMTGDSSTDGNQMVLTTENDWTYTANVENDADGTTTCYYPTLTNNAQTPAPSATWEGVTSWSAAATTAKASDEDSENDYSVSDNTYTIYTAVGLAWVASQVNAGTNNFDDEIVQLANNIDLVSANVAGYDQATIMVDGTNSWTAIGRDSDSTSFQGTFDGNDKTVSGVYINTDADYQGLFGYTNSAIIKNVTVTESQIVGTQYVGGIVGSATATTIQNCVSTAAVSGTYQRVGGIAGFAGDGVTIQDCYNTGAVSATNDNESKVGGIVGNATGGVIIQDCYNTGAVSGTSKKVGGIAGYLESDGTSCGAVLNCYNTGTVTGGTEVGGIVGATSGLKNSTQTIILATVTNCYNIGDVSGTSNVGSVVGDIEDYTTVTNCHYLAGTAALGVGSTTEDTADTASKTLAEITNGDTIVEADDEAGTPAVTFLRATALTITTPVTETSYTSGDLFDPTGLVVQLNLVNGEASHYYTRTYKDNESDFTFSPALETTLSTSDTAVTITCAGQVATQAITVKSSNSGSSSSTTTTTTTTTTTDTTTNDDGSTTATVEPSATTSNGTTSATVKDSVIDSAIEDAVDEADGEVAHVEIVVDTKTSTDTVEVKLTTDAITAVADSDVESLTITTDLGTITIPSDALAEIASQATGGDIVISLVLMEDNDHLTREQQTLVKDAQVYDLHITSDGEKIESFGGYEITVSLPYELAEGESAEHIVIWYLGDNGELVALEGNYNADAGIATFATPHFSYYAALHHNNPFTDVELDDYYYAPVMWAVELGITAGTTDTTFSPDASCTRAQAVMFLYRAAGEPEVSGDMSFTDVSADAYYYDAVLWAVENGITQGTSDTTFSPDSDCTRAQIVTFLWNYAGKPVVNYLMTFTDVDADTWYGEAVRWAVSEGITAGTSDTTFSPDALCDRGQIVTFLYRNMAE